MPLTASPCCSPGGAPNIRRYSRPNCDGLSYPTWNAASAASSPLRSIGRRPDAWRLLSFKMLLNERTNAASASPIFSGYARRRKRRARGVYAERSRRDIDERWRSARARAAHPGREVLADRVRMIFLHEVQSAAKRDDVELRQARTAPRHQRRRHEHARLDGEQQLRQLRLAQGVAIARHDRDDVRGLAGDRNLARPRQHRLARRALARPPPIAR